ncbi:MAG: preprotein translocase subunit SecE [Actinomycetota bacterium]
MKKVAWPTRTEVATYTLVVLMTVTFVTLYVFGLDNAFARGVLKVFAK